MGIRKSNQNVANKSKLAIYLGSAFLGVSEKILEPIYTYVQFFGAEVFHLGPVATDDEVKMYRYRLKKLATWDKHLREMAESVTIDASESLAMVEAAYEQLLEKGSRNIRNVDWDSVSEDGLDEEEIKHLSLLLQSKIEAEKARYEMNRLKEAQTNRIEKIQQFFPETKFAFSEDQAVDFEGTISELDKNYVGTEIKYRHIHAVSMPANGPKVSHAPITTRTIAALKSRKSTIMPHPVLMATSRNAEGLNNARNYFTTGMLYFPEDPKSTKDIHKGKHLPGFVSCVHTDDGMFFADNVVVECGGKIPFIAQDGLVFINSNTFSTGSGIESQLAWNDVHAPYQHPGVMKAGIYAGKNMESLKAITLNGDVIEMEGSNRHAERADLENKRVSQDLHAGLMVIEMLQRELGVPITWVLGNHEGWLDLKVKKNPEFEGLIDWQTVAKEWFPDIKFIFRVAGKNEVHRFGNLSFRHGDEESLEAAIEALGNTTNGHWHWFYRIGQSGKLGAACRLGPGYVGNNLTAWQSQFMTNTCYEGLTQSSYHTVLHDDQKSISRFAFRNQVITVDWK